MVSKIKTIKILFLSLLSFSLTTLSANPLFLDENGHLQGFIQENGENGYIILDENGKTQSYVQENGSNGYIILDAEGKTKGFYQKN